MRLTQAPADGHAVLRRVKVVAVAGAASVHEAHALPEGHVEVPARHGGAAGARLRLQAAHSCRGGREAVRTSGHWGAALNIIRVKFHTKSIFTRKICPKKTNVEKCTYEYELTFEI